MRRAKPPKHAVQLFPVAHITPYAMQCGYVARSRVTPPQAPRHNGPTFLDEKARQAGANESFCSGNQSDTAHSAALFRIQEAEGMKRKHIRSWTRDQT